jgi:CRISPR/Cas system-associated endonuclease Cas1
MKSLGDDSHVKTMLCQYEVYNSEKGLEVAKQLVLGMLYGLNVLLEKYGFESSNIEIYF